MLPKRASFAGERLSGALIVAWLFSLTYGETPKMIRADASFNGREIVLALGDTLEITLAENQSTPYHWNLDSDASPVCTRGKDVYEAPGGPPGAGGIHRWQFQAVQNGTGQIKLERRRVGNPPGKSVLDSFLLRVRVSK